MLAAGKEASMNGEAFFGGSSGADSAGGRGGPIATRGWADVRGQRELRHQAHAALPGDGAVRAAKFGGYRKPILAEHEAKVRDLVAARPDMTISELASELAALGIKAGRSSVYRFLRRLGLTFKKNSARRRTAPARRRRSPRRLAKRPGDSRSAPAGVHRRDLGLDQHDAALWPQ